jgi:phosphosulfolactate synthase
MNEHTLELPERAAKPRTTGFTMVVDGGLPLRSLEDLVDSAGTYLDFVKFGWGTAIVSPQIRTKIALVQSHGIDFYFGGTLFEKYVMQNRLDEYRDFCERHGCRYVEVSNGTIDISNQEKAGYIQKLGKDFSIISEVGFKNSERSERLSPRRWIEYVEEDLSAGARLVTLEARESGRSGICRPDGNLRFGLVEEIIAELPVDSLLFEAPTNALQAYFVRAIGPNANLGNIPASGVLSLETIRLGLRADTLLEVDNHSDDTFTDEEIE